jgi:hypothetical protein
MQKEITAEDLPRKIEAVLRHFNTWANLYLEKYNIKLPILPHYALIVAFLLLIIFMYSSLLFITVWWYKRTSKTVQKKKKE